MLKGLLLCPLCYWLASISAATLYSGWPMTVGGSRCPKQGVLCESVWWGWDVPNLHPSTLLRSITLPGSQVFEFTSDSVTVQLKVLMGHLLWSAKSLVFLGALDQHCSSLSPHLHWWRYCIFSLLFWEKWQLKTKPILKRCCSGVYEWTVCKFGPCEPLIPIIWVVWGNTSLAPDWHVEFGH